MSYYPKVELLVCPCNTPWGGLVPPDPCPYHSEVYGPETWRQQTYTTSTFDLLEAAYIGEEEWYIALAPVMAPQLMQELLIKLFWPLLGDFDE